MSDRRAWLGGLRSGHGSVAEITDEDGCHLEAPAELCALGCSKSVRVRTVLS